MIKVAWLLLLSGCAAPQEISSTPIPNPVVRTRSAPAPVTAKDRQAAIEAQQQAHQAAQKLRELQAIIEKNPAANP